MTSDRDQARAELAEAFRQARGVIASIEEVVEVVLAHPDLVDLVLRALGMEQVGNLSEIDGKRGRVWVEPPTDQGVET